MSDDREAVAKWLFEFRYPDHEGYWDAGHTPEFTKDQFRKKADELAALSPLLPSVQRVVDAWTKVGIAPGYHKAAQAQLIKEWPTLARAVEHLVAAQAQLGRVD